jgi:hypothetical protein
MNADEKRISEIARKERVAHDTAVARTIDHHIREANRRPSPAAMAANKEYERKRAKEEQRRLELRAQDAEDEVARLKERDAEIEVALAETKEQMFREWQAEHPDLGRATFNAKVWPVRREQLVGREARIEAAKERLLKSGNYSL